MAVKWLLCVTAFCIAGPAFAAMATTWEADFDDESKAWKEIEGQIPRYPKGQDLVLVEAGSATSHRFYVDPASVSVGTDGVVRYTTVVKTSGGALNVAFEGMRCETRELKLYALGRSDGTWVRARNAKWERIMLRDLKPHHYMLYREYFCPSPARPTPVKEALDALRRGVGLARSTATDE